MPMIVRWAGLLGGLIAGCNGVPCESNLSCPPGMYCRSNDRQCDFDCLSPADCPPPLLATQAAICTTQGRCAEVGQPPRLLVESPAPGQRFEAGVRSITVAGRVVTLGASVRLRVNTRSTGGCVTESVFERRLERDGEGTEAELPFTLDGVPLPPGASVLEVSATDGTAIQTYTVDVELACPGCPEVIIDEPSGAPVLLQPFLPRLAGRVAPQPDGAGFWRVQDPRGQVVDGQLEVDADGTFRQDRLPVFPGLNRVDVTFPVSGQPVEGRCSAAVNGPAAGERELRAILTWDREDTDLDLVLLGPGATLLDFENVLSPRLGASGPLGTIIDDFDGEGPELLTSEALADGTYGLVVEALSDGVGGGSNALVRVLYEGLFMTERPLGPRFVSALRGDLWVVGAVRIEAGRATFVEVDEVLADDVLPERTPEDWPTLFE